MPLPPIDALQVGRKMVTKGSAGAACVLPCSARAYPAGMNIEQSVVAVLLIVGGICAGWLLRSRSGRQDVAAAPLLQASDDGDGRPWLVDLRAVADALSTAAVVFDLRLRVEHANPCAVRDFPALAIGAFPTQSSEAFGAVLAQVVESEDLVAHETIFIGDNPPQSVRITAARFRAYVLVLLEDATDEVDFEEARRAFSAAVSHELRTPLARILGLAETLALPDIEDERDHLVDQIEHEVDGIRQLIDEMLLLAALDRGRLAVAGGVADASAITFEVVEAAKQSRLGRGREIAFSTTGILPVAVAARLFEVVVENLVDNALLHGGPDARVVVSVENVDEQALLTVVDSGPGIAAQHMPFVFQRFYRGDASRAGPGSGLGLALVKHIVEAHGGTVSAESDGVSGTTLRVYLPLA